MPVQLGVNIDHVATLRRLRGTAYPDPLVAARIAQDAGADQITCHLREDRRHIQDQDIPALLEVLDIPLNLEMAATAEMLQIALRHRPAKVTLVPERREELTTEGGLDVASQREFLKEYVAALSRKGISVALFIDAAEAQIKASRFVNAPAVELHTGSYAQVSFERRALELERLCQAAVLAAREGFFVAAGHGLNYENILSVKKIVEIKEFNIGHSVVAHAVMVGWERAVQEMKALLGA